MNLITAFSLIFLIINQAFADVEIKEEDGVLVLTKENFNSVISDNDFVLVEFYAPWCGHCKALAPEYSKAAKELADKESKIKLGKIDATEEEDLAKEYDVKGYPTLKFFRNGQPIDYSGGRDAAQIVAWLEKKTGPAAKELKTVEEAKQFIEENKVAVVGFFSDQTSDKAKAYLSVANAVDDYQFGITSDEAIYKEYEATCGSIVLFKQFDEGKSIFEGEHTEQNIKSFVTSESLPNLVEFNHETAPKIFGGEIKSHLLIFVSKSDDKTSAIVSAARSVAKPYKSKILFVTIDVEEEDHQRILEFFGIKKEEVPTARIIKLEEEMSKFKTESSELDAESITTFVDKFLKGELKQHLLSQELPEDWNKQPVRVLVASNFDEVVLDKSKDVLVEFYAPWCGHCKQLVPIYEKVAEHFESNDDVVIAKIDSTANELEHTRITSFPTIKLYKKEDNKVIDYNGPRTFEGLSKFVESGGVEDGAAEEPVEEETEDDDTARRDEL